jgi:hypothetical protein
MTRLTSAVLLTLALPASAFASLGGTVTSVEADRVQTKSALIGIQRTVGYSVHEMLSPTGTTIREYYGSDGVVFGVAWDGEWTPDLRQLFGTYFDQYQRSTTTARRAGRTSHAHVAIDENGLTVRASGHARSSHGVAYVPSLVPPGITPDVVR